MVSVRLASRCALLLSATALAISGCGSTESPGHEATTSSPTTSQRPPTPFAVQADRICIGLVKAVARGPNPGLLFGSEHPTNLSAGFAIVAQRRAAFATAARRTRALPLPGGPDGRKAAAYVRAFAGEIERAVVPVFARFVPALKNRDRRALARVAAQAARVDFSASNAAAVDLGMRCRLLARR